MITVITEGNVELKLGQRISRSKGGWIRLDAVVEHFFGASVTYTTAKGQKVAKLPVTYFAPGRTFSRVVVVKD